MVVIGIAQTVLAVRIARGDHPPSWWKL